ncbi:mariner Mos1 transposase [Trichonephila clavipes]|nr:mariner Mos1 transposase [Trichonephila clavipes]
MNFVVLSLIFLGVAFTVASSVGLFWLVRHFVAFVRKRLALEYCDAKPVKNILIFNYEMSAMDLSCYQIITVVYFQFCCKKSTTKCHRIMRTALGTSVVSYDTVLVWYRKFKNKDYDIQEAENSGEPTDFGGKNFRIIFYSSSFIFG